MEAAEAMNVGKSTMDKWVRKLKSEHKGVTSPDQIEIREL